MRAGRCAHESLAYVRGEKERDEAAHLGDLALLPVVGDALGRLLLRLDGVGEEVGDHGRHRRRRLTKAARDAQLLFVDLLDALLLLVLEDGLEVVLRAVQQRDTNVGLLERADIVRAVAGHERHEPEALERREDELLLRGRHAGVDPRVLHELVPRLAAVGVLLERGARHADVVAVKERRVEGRRRVNRDHDRLVGRAPGEVW